MGNRQATQYVYVFRRRDGLYKIGRSWLVSRRLSQLRAQDGLPLELVYAAKNGAAVRLEHHLHELFKERREHGEWFRLTDADLALLNTVAPNVSRYGHVPGTGRRLTEWERQEIRAVYVEPLSISQAELGRRHGVSAATIRKVVNQ